VKPSELLINQRSEGFSLPAPIALCPYFAHTGDTVTSTQGDSTPPHHNGGKAPVQDLLKDGGMTETETIALVAFFFGLMIFAVLFIFSWAIYHRPKYHSLTVTKRNLTRDAAGQMSFSQHPVDDDEAKAVLEIVDALITCRRSYGPLTKRALYLSIVAVALFCVMFNPYPVWMRVGVGFAVVVVVLLLVFAALKPLRNAFRTNKLLTVHFEEWAKDHPEYSEKAPKSRRRQDETAQSYISSEPSASSYAAPLPIQPSEHPTASGTSWSSSHDDDSEQRPWQ
jgi:uncharacterized membrane protein